jgi:uncharacterized protein (TIGR02145 family)
MGENLRVTKYRNGSSIPDIEDENKWQKDTIGAYCYYLNGINYGTTFGCLYNYYSVADKRNLCPAGWHVPTIDEWTVLSTYLGGENISGAKLKETGTTHWDNPNTGATNETGFTALPGGCRLQGFIDIGSDGCWWSSTAINNYSSVTTTMYSSGGSFSVGREASYFYNGLSVRCLKDN